MRKVIAFALTLFCLIVSSCQKPQDYQDYLVGTWKVSMTTTISVSSGGIADGSFTTDGYHTFGRDGTGSYAFDGTEQSFTYQYQEKSNSILYIVGSKQVVWSIDELGKDTFVFHAEGEILFHAEGEISLFNAHQVVVLRGKKYL